MWKRSNFLVDREEVDRFLCEREYACVRLAETIERARAFPTPATDLLGLVHFDADSAIDGIMVVEHEGTVHCVLPSSEQEDNSLSNLMNSCLHVKRVTGPTNDTFRVMRVLKSTRWSTQSYTLMRLRNSLIAQGHTSKMDFAENNHFEIIDATESDLEALISLHREYEREELFMNSSHTETELRIRALQAHQMISIAYFEGLPVGKINTNARGIFCDQIGGFYVMPAHRAKGIGTMLFYHFLSRIQGAEKDAVLYVRSANIVARRIYDRAGFLPVGEYAMSTVSPTH